MAKVKVTVKDIPVRYNGEDYEPGDTVEIEDKHFDENLYDKETKK